MDAALYLPYKALFSTVKNMMFSEGEAQQLIEILNEKAGVGTWHTVSERQTAFPSADVHTFSQYICPLSHTLQ